MRTITKPKHQNLNHWLFVCLLALTILLAAMFSIPSQAHATTALITHGTSEEMGFDITTASNQGSAPLQETSHSDTGTLAFIPLSSSTSGPLAITTSTPVGEQATQLITEVRLKTSTGRLIAAERDTWENPNAGNSVVRFEIPLADRELSTGLYQVQVVIALDEDGAVKRADQTYLVHLHATHESLRSAIILKVSLPPQHNPDGTLNNEVSHAHKQVAQELNNVLDALSTNHKSKVTLALPSEVLLEWQELASKQDQPYNQLLERMRRAQEAGKLEIVINGKSDPNIDALEYLGEMNILQEQYPGLSDTQYGDLTLTKGAAPHATALSPRSAQALEQAGVPWVVIPYNEERLAKPGASRVGVLQENSSLTVLLSDQASSEALTANNQTAFLKALSQTHTEFEHHLTQGTPAEHLPYIAVATLTGRDGEEQSLASNLRQFFSADVIEAQFASDLVPQVEPELITFSVPNLADAQGVDAAYYSSLKQASLQVKLLEKATDKDAAVRKQTHAYLTRAVSGGWVSGVPGLDLAGAKAQADRARALCDEVFSGVTILATSHQLATGRGEIPLVLKNDQDVPLNLTVKVQGVGQVSIPDNAYVDGVAASTKPGDNYLQVPVRLGSGPAGGDASRNAIQVTVQIDEAVIATQEIPVQSSRSDIIGIFSVATVGFIGIIVILRRVLRRDAIVQSVTQRDAQGEDLEDITHLSELEHVRSDALEDLSGHDEIERMTLAEIAEQLRESDGAGVPDNDTSNKKG